ncbi:MAG: uracil-DNA glycosylase family protein [Candidatus Thorarchaeota archaeon]|jgi:hypothetical protein
MTLKGFARSMKKGGHCHLDCEFRRRKETDLAKLPPPDEIWGVIISRDPTFDWKDFYEYTYEHIKKRNADLLRTQLFASAIPVNLLKRICRFMGADLTHKERDGLFEAIMEKTYWTHLHKCFTDTRRESSLAFKIENARICAESWLKDELEYAMKSEVKVIIALGNDVKSQMKRWDMGDERVIFLPHPSGQNNGIWHRSPKVKREVKERIEEQIAKLMSLLP